MMMSMPVRQAVTFTPEELEELRAFDAEIDAAEMTQADYESEAFVEELLFPEVARERERAREARQQKAKVATEAEIEARRKWNRTYRESHKEEEAARKARWYQENKERIRAQQRDYLIRSGKARTPEQKAADKVAAKERQRERSRAYSAAHKEKLAAYQKAYREAHKEELRAKSREAYRRKCMQQFAEAGA